MDFPSKAALKRHYSRVHPNGRNRDLGSAVVSDVPLLADIDKKRIVRQAGASAMFACELQDDTFVWRYMPLDRPIVKEFLANKDRSFVYEDLPLADLNAWHDGFVMLE